MHFHRSLLMSAAVAGFAIAASAARASVYVTNFSDGTVSVVPNGGGAATTFATGFTDPEGIAYNPSGGLYVADESSGGAIESVSSTGAVSPFVTIPGGYGLSGLVTDAAGNLYLSLQSSGTIDKITPSGSVSTYATGAGNPQGLSFDAAGDLFVADYNDGIVDKIAPGGGAASVFATLISVVGIAVDPAGDVYASSNSSGDVEKYSPLGVDLGSYAAVPNAYGIAFDSGGNLLIPSTDQFGDGTTVYAVPAGGGSVYTYATGFDGPLYIAQAITVPEPASLAVLVVAGLGGSLGRRSRA